LAICHWNVGSGKAVHFYDLRSQETCRCVARPGREKPFGQEYEHSVVATKYWLMTFKGVHSSIVVARLL